MEFIFQTLKKYDAENRIIAIRDLKRMPKLKIRKVSLLSLIDHSKPSAKIKSGRCGLGP